MRTAPHFNNYEYFSTVSPVKAISVLLPVKILILLAFLILFINGYSQMLNMDILQKNLATRNTY